MSRSKEALLIAYKKGYRIDKDGNVFSPKKKKISLSINSDGYYKFTVRTNINNKIRNDLVPAHRLQAYQKFKNKLFKDGIEVRHLDDNKLNNCYENIDIGTRSQNKLDIQEERRKTISQKGQKLAVKAIRCFSDNEVKQILEDKDSGMSYNQLRKKYKAAKSTFSYMFNKSEYGRVS